MSFKFCSKAPFLLTLLLAFLLYNITVDWTSFIFMCLKPGATGTEPCWTLRNNYKRAIKLIRTYSTPDLSHKAEKDITNMLISVVIYETLIVCRTKGHQNWRLFLAFIYLLKSLSPHISSLLLFIWMNFLKDPFTGKGVGIFLQIWSGF